MTGYYFGDWMGPSQGWGLTYKWEMVPRRESIPWLRGTGFGFAFTVDIHLCHATSAICLRRSSSRALNIISCLFASRWALCCCCFFIHQPSTTFRISSWDTFRDGLLGWLVFIGSDTAFDKAKGGSIGLLDSAMLACIAAV